MRNIFVLWILISFIPHIAFSASPGGPIDRELLSKTDARKALAIANEWRWSRPEIKSHITPLEIVFNFPDGHVIRIPLPEDKMMVAVAPYLNRTHA